MLSPSKRQTLWLRPAAVFLSYPTTSFLHIEYHKEKRFFQWVFSAAKNSWPQSGVFSLGCSVVNGVYLKSPSWQPIVAQKVPYSWQKKEISSHICAFAHTPYPPLHLGADLPLLFVKGMSVNIQRSGYLSMA